MKSNTLNSETPARPSLDNLFEFVNEDIEPLPESNFMGLLHTYTKFVCQYESKYPFLQFREKHDEYTHELLPPKSPETLLERKEFFSELQAHLRSKLQAIIDTVESKTTNSTEPLMEMKGTRQVFVDPTGDSFSEGFSPDGLKSGHGLDLGNEKALADLVFSDIVRDTTVQPSRFGTCPRCKRFFYQTTAKERIYCSAKCASAARQADYLERKKKKEKPKKTRKKRH